MQPTKEIGKEVIEHWYTLVASQQFSAREFYDHIEKEIKTQRVPGLELSRIDLAEGGALSDRREYLRMKRERLTFDVCAAPVGINYFFSYRFYLEPIVIKVWEVIVLASFVAALLVGSIRTFGVIMGSEVLILGCVLAEGFMRNAIGLGLRDLDAALIKLPAIGPFYERFLRKDTYYRQDMRIAYCSIVAAIVKQEVLSITGEKGIRLLREYTYSPVLKDLYRAADISAESQSSAPEAVNA